MCSISISFTSHFEEKERYHSKLKFQAQHFDYATHSFICILLSIYTELWNDKVMKFILISKASKRQDSDLFLNFISHKVDCVLLSSLLTCPWAPCILFKEVYHFLKIRRFNFHFLGEEAKATCLTVLLQTTYEILFI